MKCNYDPLEKVVSESQKVVLDSLNKIGLSDHVTVKIKEFEGKPKNWIGMYRGLTQFRGNGYPIMWINADLYPNLDRVAVEIGECVNPYDAVTDTLLHEYGHAIAEWGEKREPEIAELIHTNWVDEEDFAEDFMRFTRDDTSYKEEVHQKIVAKYKESAFE